MCPPAIEPARDTVQALRQRFEREKSRLDEALVFHASQVRPRMERVSALRAEVVRALYPFLDDSRLKRGDREILADILAAQLDGILETQDTLDQDLQDLFERLNGIALAEVVQEQLDDAKAGMAALFADLGLDKLGMDVPDLRADMTDEEVAATVATMADQMRQLEEERASSEQPRRRTKRRLKQEQQAQQFEQWRKIGIGSIYKRLVKTLHPDLEPDAGARATRVSARRVQVSVSRGGSVSQTRAPSEFAVTRCNSFIVERMDGAVLPTPRPTPD